MASDVKRSWATWRYDSKTGRVEINAEIHTADACEALIRQTKLIERVIAINLNPVTDAETPPSEGGREVGP